MGLLWDKYGLRFRIKLRFRVKKRFRKNLMFRMNLGPKPHMIPRLFGFCSFVGGKKGYNSPLLELSASPQVKTKVLQVDFP